jgi:transposase-like protein
MTASTRAEELELAWRQRLTRFAASGQAVKAFCRQEAVSAWSFHHWRRRLQQPAGLSAAGADPAAFVDLGAITTNDARSEPAAVVGAASLTIRLDLPGGILLTIARS